MICSYFLPFCGLLFALLMVSFNAQKFSVLMESNLFFPLLSVVLVLCWLGIFWLHMTNAINLNRNCISECKEKFRSRPRSDMVRSTNYSDGISTLSFYIIAPDFLFFFKCLFFLAIPGLSCDLWDRNPGSLHWECRVLSTGPPGKVLSWPSTGLLHSHPSPFQKYQASMALAANNPGRETFMLILPKSWGTP